MFPCPMRWSSVRHHWLRSCLVKTLPTWVGRLKPSLKSIVRGPTAQTIFLELRSRSIASLWKHVSDRVYVYIYAFLCAHIAIQTYMYIIMESMDIIVKLHMHLDICTQPMISSWLMLVVHCPGINSKPKVKRQQMIVCRTYVPHKHLLAAHII